MDVDIWASLPTDLLLEIFGRLETTAVLRSTGVCKPWRRTIIGNAASCLRPRPDCFVPELLLGFFHNYRDKGRHVRLRCLAWPLESAATAVTTIADTTVSSFIQADGGADLASYDELLSSRDGLLLLSGRAAQDLCLCSLVTGDRKFLPAATFKADTYVLVTGYDLTLSDGGGDHDLKALVLAVKEKDIKAGMTYQIFSTCDGAWGEVMRSPVFKKGLATRIYPGSEVICHGSEVHWLGMAADAGVVKCTVAIDVRTCRTWLTALPQVCWPLDCYSSLNVSPIRLATSRNGQLSVVTSIGTNQIEVWVLAGGDQWMLRTTINVESLLSRRQLWFSSFCPRSGCLLGHVQGQDLLIDMERGSCRLAGCIDTNHGGRIYPYEMDWSTYISKMKLF
ncbi:hypothetical protein BAE44_0009303 [Dichanthelium oligosanthes]|uniref:Uncharacterized protein n=1 Tax=Dichanthelium oligosanthes TaxID=888268 RepID=A0A1E5VX43_9POAL|nr:hypothetical protein BAE44_0009303 [Dichanthelium oligosanthes]